VLQKTSGVFWFESSVRFNSPNLDPSFNVVIWNGGVSMFSASYHSTFAATNPSMWDYLVTDPERQKEVYQLQAGVVQLYYRTQKTVNGILVWHLLCAFVRSCITPTGVHCSFPSKNSMRRRKHGCHRYDQSAINTLFNNFTTAEFLLEDPERMVVVVKEPSTIMSPEIC
jgi:hypothetical protein